MRKYILLFFLTLHCFTLYCQQKTGIASYYHSKFAGRKTASGAIFSNQKMTAASNHFKLGEWVKVTNMSNGKFVYVLINDRMAKNSQRLIDLTHVAAQSLCFMQNGVCRVSVEKCGKPVEIISEDTDRQPDSLATSQ
ncbi:MAG: septal ring lytic transglycosylase RlpA family protein [Chitinophagaceae bacterium]|nr:septal ring lytic transglycosylase RlpA family protein [Chitinophagaceae bacterium]